MARFINLLKKFYFFAVVLLFDPLPVLEVTPDLEAVLLLAETEDFAVVLLFEAAVDFAVVLLFVTVDFVVAFDFVVEAARDFVEVFFFTGA